MMLTICLMCLGIAIIPAVFLAIGTNDNEETVTVAAPSAQAKRGGDIHWDYRLFSWITTHVFRCEGLGSLYARLHRGCRRRSMAKDRAEVGWPKGGEPREERTPSSYTVTELQRHRNSHSPGWQDDRPPKIHSPAGWLRTTINAKQSVWR